MNKTIIISLALIAAVGVIATGATVSYFSDTETSKGNTFTAGAIDLTVDNTCYYNGVECMKDGTVYHYWDTNKNGSLDVGEKVTENRCHCTWELTDLDGELFFDFHDIKPGDHGEDTISLYVTSNDAWSCAKIELTENNDMTCVDPEVEEEGIGNCVVDGTFDGELAQNLEFVWWADDGDNVLEVGELVTAHGAGTIPFVATTDDVVGVSLYNIVDGISPWTRDLIIADSKWNMFDTAGGPLAPDTDYYVAKAWCFGDLAITPVEQLNTWDPTNADNITCNGVDVTNASQTDKVVGTLSFTAEQSRNNTKFECPERK